MNRYIEFYNYMPGIREVDVVVYVMSEHIEGKHAKPKRYYFPMDYDELRDVWQLDLEAVLLYEYQFMYRFMINKRFIVNQVNADYMNLGQQMVSVYVPDGQEVEYESDCGATSLYTFAEMGKKTYRKTSFSAIESIVQLACSLNNRTNVLVQAVWLCPNEQIYEITEQVIEPECNGYSSIALRQDYESLYGQWSVELYTSRRRLASTRFLVSSETKYQFCQIEPTVDIRW